MNAENALLPRQDQIVSLLGLGGDQPIQMLNLLRFHDIARYDDPAEPVISGREAYLRYAEPMTRLVTSRGGRIQFSADIDALVIGDVADLWDVAAIMEYPSRAAFVAIATSPEVQAISHHRKAGLAGQLLIQCSPAPGIG